MKNIEYELSMLRDLKKLENEEKLQMLKQDHENSRK